MPKSTGEQSGTEFLNVDLDVISKRPLAALVDAFGNTMDVLYCGRWGRRHSANFEWSGAPVRRSADLLIRRLVAAVERLPRDARRLWNGADVREFNVGIEAAAKSTLFELRLRPATLAAVMRVNGTLVVTVYAPERLPMTALQRSKSERPPKPRTTRRR